SPPSRTPRLRSTTARRTSGVIADGDRATAQRDHLLTATSRFPTEGAGTDGERSLDRSSPLARHEGGQELAPDPRPRTGLLTGTHEAPPRHGLPATQHPGGAAVRVPVADRAHGLHRVSGGLLDLVELHAVLGDGGPH